MNEKNNESLVKRTVVALVNKFLDAFRFEEMGISPVESMMFMSYSTGFWVMDSAHTAELYSRTKEYNSDSRS